MKELLMCGLTCVTMLLYVHAGYKFSRSPFKPPKEDVIIMCLSVVQIIVTFIFHGFLHTPALYLAGRLIKILQAVCISWMFLYCYISFDRLKPVNALFIVLMIYFCVIYGVGIRYIDLSLCRDVTWLCLSSSWFVLSINMSFVSYYTIKSIINRDIDTGEVLDKEEVDTTFWLVSFKALEKKRRLFALLGVEMICASISVIWDIALINIKTLPNRTCESEFSQFELSLFILTHLTNSLIPHWIIYYVFYWVDRNVYTKLAPGWDVMQS